MAHAPAVMAFGIRLQIYGISHKSPKRLHKVSLNDVVILSLRSLREVKSNQLLTIIQTRRVRMLLDVIDMPLSSHTEIDIQI